MTTTKSIVIEDIKSKKEIVEEYFDYDWDNVGRLPLKRLRKVHELIDLMCKIYDGEVDFEDLEYDSTDDITDLIMTGLGL